MRPIDFWRSIVRPVITTALVGAFIYAALFDEGGVEHLKELTFMAAAFWFADRNTRD